MVSNTILLEFVITCLFLILYYLILIRLDLSYIKKYMHYNLLVWDDMLKVMDKHNNKEEDK